MTVDSGAGEVVIPEDALQGIPTRQSPGSQAGVMYEVANGELVPNEGEEEFVAETEDGHLKSIVAQVCKVNKGLMPVKKMCQHGNRVIFDDEGSYIQNKRTGEVTWLREAVCVYQLSFWVKRNREAAEQVLSRQGN